jgi:hypothetical protein
MPGKHAGEGDGARDAEADAKRDRDALLAERVTVGDGELTTQARSKANPFVPFWPPKPPPTNLTAPNVAPAPVATYDEPPPPPLGCCWLP